MLTAVLLIVAAGEHGELNRRIKRAIPRTQYRRVRTPKGRVIEELRLLDGAHDAEAFARDVVRTAEGEITRALADGLARTSGGRRTG